MFAPAGRLRGSVVPAFSAANVDHLGYDKLRDTLGAEMFDRALERGRLLRSDGAAALARERLAAAAEA